MKWNLGQGWRFFRGTVDESVIDKAFDDSGWELVHIPHTARIEAAMCSGGENYRGICWYRKRFFGNEIADGDKVFLEFEGAKHVTTVWLNGKEVGQNLGGYLPFVFDITDHLLLEGENVVVVQVDNNDYAEIPPGKSQDDLDFCYFAGLYRPVWLESKKTLHITHPVYAGQKAGGGVFVTCHKVSDEEALLNVRTHVTNDGEMVRQFEVVHTLVDHMGNVVANAKVSQTLAGKAHGHTETKLVVSEPTLWHIENPYLYTVISQVVESGRVMNEVTTPVGIRTICFDGEGFALNGEVVKLNGANKHQEYAYIGDALSDEMHYREALKLKEAGFNFVRTGHYPPGAAFIRACDEIGLVCVVPIPGWQWFVDSDLFKERSYQNVRDMVRYYRNHPSIVLWEPILNETWYSEEYARQTYQITHEEYPGDQCYAASDATLNGGSFFDVQYGNREKTLPAHKSCIVREYGDNYREQFGPQKTLKRCTRGFSGFYPYGEEAMTRSGLERMAQLACLYRHRQIAGIAVWTGIDCNRGYMDNIAATGILDIYRLPKMSYYAYRSQEAKVPMIYASTYWEKAVEPLVVYSNCDTVKVYINERFVAEGKPDADYVHEVAMSIYGTHIQCGILNEIPIDMVEPDAKGLKHPPFVFKGLVFEQGVLRVEGYNAGVCVVSQEVRTPGVASKLELVVDTMGRELVADGSDTVMIQVYAKDAYGTLVPSAEPVVRFEVTGEGELVGDGMPRTGVNPAKLEAGAVGVLVRSTTRAGQIKIVAHSEGLESAELVISSVGDTQTYVGAPVEAPLQNVVLYPDDLVLKVNKPFFNEFDRAAHKPVKASSAQEGFGPECVVDNTYETLWRATDQTPQWIEIDLGTAMDLTGCKVWWQSDNTNYFYRILVSSDGVNYREMLSKMGTGQDIRPDYFGADETRLLRVEIDEVTKGVAEICSIQIFGVLKELY